MEDDFLHLLFLIESLSITLCIYSYLMQIEKCYLQLYLNEIKRIFIINFK